MAVYVGLLVERPVLLTVLMFTDGILQSYESSKYQALL